MLKSTIYELAIASVIDNTTIISTMEKVEIVETLTLEKCFQRSLEEDRRKKEQNAE